MKESEVREISIDTAVHTNLKVMVGDYKIAAKDYPGIMLPIVDLLNKLSTREWIVVRNPGHPANALKASTVDSHPES